MQPNTNELQNIKTDHSKLSKLLDVTSEAENINCDNLGFVKKYGGSKTMPKVNYSQAGGNFKTEEVTSKLLLQTKGQTVAKFGIKIQPRVLERRIRHEEVQQRREAIEQEKNTARLGSKEKNVNII